MTSERATKIIAECRRRATFGPWSDQLKHVMTAEEDQEVKALWQTMPCHTCYVDALLRFRDGRA